jgi:ribosomal protein S18 acetylase RimI-like enzyme
MAQTTHDESTGRPSADRGAKPPLPDVCLRPATPRDAAFLAWGLDEAAGRLFAALFGGRSHSILTRVMARSGHGLSYEHATVADAGGEARGFCQGWPAGTRSADAAIARAAGLRALRASVLSLFARPVVHALGRHSPGEWYLQALVVTPSARGAGIGRRLFADALGRAASAGSAALTLDVDAANRRALSLYERLGLRVVSTASAPLLGGLSVHRMTRAVSGRAGVE